MTSPLRNLHAQAEAEFTVFPPPGSVCAGDSEPVEIVETFGDLDLERAALATGAGLLDCPHRAVLTLTGADRLDLLDRVLTQNVGDLAPGRWAPAFLLNRQGRILADLRVIPLDDRVLLELHSAVAAAAQETLDGFIFTEDAAATLPPVDEAPLVLDLIGPGADAALSRTAGSVDWTPGPGERSAAALTIADAGVIALRDGGRHVPSLALIAARASAVSVYHHVLESGAGDGADSVRAVGWRAVDEQRVRARVPLHLMEFGSSSLPHETGVLHDRVSFTKGCYPGQEIVARMQSRGGAKQLLVALTMSDPAPPAIGAPLRQADEPESDAIGVITSAAAGTDREPAVALAQVRAKHAAVGTGLRVEDDQRAVLDELIGAETP